MNELIENIIDKLSALEREVSSSRGKFSLFALFLREGAENMWDVVVAAPWLMADLKASYSFIAQQIQSHLAPDELASISRIAIINATSPGVEAIADKFHVEHGLVEVRETFFFGIMIRTAYIITAVDSPSSVQASPAVAAI